MGDFDFGSREEMQRAFENARRPPKPPGYNWQLYGGLIGLALGAAVSFALGYTTKVPAFRLYAGITVGAMFAGCGIGHLIWMLLNEAK